MSDVFKSADWAREALAKKQRPPRQSPFVFELSEHSSTFEFSPRAPEVLEFFETKERVRKAFFPPKLYNFKSSTDA